MKLAHVNYDKNKYDNSNKPIKRDDVKIYDSIFEAVDDKFDKSQLKGYGIKDLSPAEKSVLNLIIRTSKKMEGGKLSKESFKKALKVSAPIAKKVGATGVRVGLPLVSGMVAQSLGIPAPLAVGLTSIAADAIAKKIGGFKVINPASKVSLISEHAPKKKRGGKMTKAQKDKLAKNLVKTFGAVALAGATKYILPKVVDHLGSKYGVTPELAREIFGLARFLVEATVSATVSGGACSPCDNDDVGLLCTVKGSGLSEQDKALHDALSKAVQKHLKGGKLDASKFKREAIKMGKKALPLAKKGAPLIAKAGVPLATKAIGEQLGLPPSVSNVVGKVLGDIASDELKKLGKGRRLIKKDIAQYKGGAKPAGQSRQQARAQKVREIMEKEGLSLPKASKYIKENNIEY
jgi:hypothetical protein